MRPVDLPSAQSFSHGTRARYVAGCRCAPCRAANSAYYHQRQDAKKAAAPTVQPSGPPGQGTLMRGGVAHRVRTCPGANGAPCLRTPAAWLRGTHDVCGTCVERVTVWNGNVPVAAVRRHLLRLRRKGIGYKSVAAACDVASSTLAGVLQGTGGIRAATARRVLAVDAGAIADHATVPAGSTWKLLEQLLAEGFTEADLAHRLGFKTPRLQFGKVRVLAVTALRVRRLHSKLMGDA